MYDAFLFNGAPPPASTFLSGAGQQPTPRGTWMAHPSNRRRHSKSRAIVGAFSLPAELRIQLPFLLQGFRLLASRSLPETVLADALRDLMGKHVTRARVWSALHNAEEWFGKNGYVASRLAVAAWPSAANDQFLIVAVVEAILVRVRIQAVTVDDQVDPTTRVRTTQRTICRALGIKIGDVFRWRPQNFDRLMHLGVFDYARAELDPISLHEVGVTVSVREKSSTVVEPGAGMSSDGGVFGDISVREANFLGRAQRIRMDWQRPLGAPHAVGSMEFEDPRIGAAIPFSYRLGAYRHANQAQGLHAASRGAAIVSSERLQDRDGVFAALSWKPRMFSKFTFSIGPVLERIRQPSEYDGSEQTDNQAMMILSARHVTSNEGPLPHMGHRMTLDYGTGRTFEFRSDHAGVDGGNPVFHRVSAKISQYFQLGRKGSVALGINYGTGSENVPTHEKTAVGGPGSVRGYRTGQLGRSANFATARFEMRVPLHEPKSVKELVHEAEVKAESERTSNGPPSNGMTASMPIRDGSSSEQDELGSKEIRTRMVITADHMKDGKLHKLPEIEYLEEPGKFGLPKLPHLVGVVFTDLGSADLSDPKCIRSSIGIGLRIANFLTVELTRSQTDGMPRLQFGMVDRDL